ncbi:MAG: YgjV family protein [Alphaproteobacteria bacterium]|nr:YgjV family protein [Alphaproteobacteria bacterium]
MNAYLSLILGNILAAIGSACVIISVVKKNKRDLIWWQTINIFFCMFSSIALSAYAALVTNCFALIRNILACKNKLNSHITFILSFLCLITGLYMNNLGLIGLLAIIASVSYTVFIYITKNDQQMRYAIIFNSVLWLIHDYYIKSYPTFLTGIIFILWTIIQIFKNRAPTDTLSKHQKNTHPIG